LPDSVTGLVKAGDIPCKGNNIAVGFTDGTNINTIYRSTSNGNAYSPSITGVGEEIGINTGGSGGSLTVQRTLGITTDSIKSGIIADTASLIISCSMIIKY